MRTNRRSFLVATGLTALAAGKAMGANDTIRLGAIGCGGRMRNILDSADKNGGFELVAGCDVYEPHREDIRTRTADMASTHLDYHELLDKKDIDAVAIAAPDHWHVRMACDAVAAGKDVYLEKPVTHTIEEGATLIKAVRDSKRIVQCGMQQRSWAHFADAVDLIQNGSIGRITRIRTFWYQNYQGRRQKAYRSPTSRLEALAGQRTRPSFQRGEISPLALVLEFWWRRLHRSIHSLD